MCAASPPPPRRLLTRRGSRRRMETPFTALWSDSGTHRTQPTPLTAGFRSNRSKLQPCYICMLEPDVAMQFLFFFLSSFSSPLLSLFALHSLLLFFFYCLVHVSFFLLHPSFCFCSFYCSLFLVFLFFFLFFLLFLYFYTFHPTQFLEFYARKRKLCARAHSRPFCSSSCTRSC